jgi:hypothetical protein
MTSATTQEILGLLNECTPLYDDINRLIAGYAERFIFKEGDVIYNRDGVEGLNIKYIIQKKTKNYMKLYKCIGWYSIPLKNVLDISKNKCQCVAGCERGGYLVHYKTPDNEETGNIRRSSFNTKKYFIYKYRDNLVCCEIGRKPVRRNLRYNAVMDEYITTTSKYRPIHARTHILSNVDEIVNDMDIQTNLNM